MLVASRTLLCIAITASLLFRGAAADLGSYSGPQGVGTIDLEIAVENPRTITNLTIKNNGKPAFRLDTVRFTLYYPTVPGTRSSKPPHPWLSEPAGLIAKGLSDAIGGAVSPDLIQVGFNLFASTLTIPAQVDVALAPGSGKLPLVMFSHGNPTMSAWYSQFYGELASRGIVTAAVTHRDGSSPATSVKFLNGTSYNLTAFTQDQVLPPMNDTDFHQQQLEMRHAEFIEVVNILVFITSGDGGKVFNASSRGEGQDLTHWKDRLNVNQLIVAGQSFGSNAVFRYLRDLQPPVPASAALTFDPGKDSGPLTNVPVTVPILIPDSEEWSAIPKDFFGTPHFQVVKSIAQGALDRTGAGWFMTLLGTIHTSVTDVGLIAPSFAGFFSNETSRLTLDPKIALLEYVKVATDFVTYLYTKNLTGLLATNVTYPNFQVFPNASTLNTPWEVHVAPTVPRPRSSLAMRSTPLPHSILVGLMFLSALESSLRL